MDQVGAPFFEIDTAAKGEAKSAPPKAEKKEEPAEATPKTTPEPEKKVEQPKAEPKKEEVKPKTPQQPGIISIGNKSKRKQSLPLLFLV